VNNSTPTDWRRSACHLFAPVGVAGSLGATRLRSRQMPNRDLNHSRRHQPVGSDTTERRINPMRVSKEALALSIVVRRVRIGANPFSWEVHRPAQPPRCRCRPRGSAVWKQPIRPGRCAWRPSSRSGYRRPWRRHSGSRRYRPPPGAWIVTQDPFVYPGYSAAPCGLAEQLPRTAWKPGFSSQSV